MGKKKIYLSFVLAIIISGFSYAQEIKILDKFQPYEWIGDTMYYNKNHYDYVLTQTFDTDKPFYSYESRFFILKDLADLRYKSEFPRFKYKYKLPKKVFANSDADGLYSTKIWRSPKPLKNNFIKITRTKADYYLKESSILLPGVKKDTLKLFTALDLELFPMLIGPMDSMLQFLHFGNMETYYIYIRQTDSLKVSLSYSDICNPINHSEKNILSKKELKDIFIKYIEHIDFPYLKVDNEVMNYSLEINIGFDYYVRVKIREEKKNNFRNSQKVFPTNDSLFAIVDSFNNRTIFYLPEIWDEKLGHIGVYTAYRLIDTQQNLTDVTGDGVNDLVLDTTFYANTSVSNVGDVYTIKYIPNSASLMGFDPQIVEQLQYTQYLGNNYYYLAEDDNEAKIFHIKNNKQELVLGVEHNFYNAKDKKTNQLYAHIYANKRPELSGVLKYYSKKGVAMRKSMTELIQYYIKYPEKLPVDFPMN